LKRSSNVEMLVRLEEMDSDLKTKQNRTTFGCRTKAAEFQSVALCEYFSDGLLLSLTLQGTLPCVGDLIFRDEAVKQ
jgi:hypothetical protein